MRKWFLGVLCGVMCLALTACGGEKVCDHHYESEEIRQASYSSTGEIRKTCIFCGDEIMETVPQWPNPLEVSVTGIETVVQEREPLVMPDGSEIFQTPLNWIVFELDVKNVSEADIRAFSGVITIQDQDRRLNVSGTFRESIPAGETVHLSGYGFQVSSTDLTMTDNMLIGKTLEEITVDFMLREVSH